MKITAGVLVIGGGLAGLCAALRAKELGCDVVVAAKGKAGKSGNTIMARNSMAVVFSNNKHGDSVENHMEDTMCGGAGINDRSLVRVMAENGEEAVRWLEKMGVPFLKDEKGNFIVKQSPGHSSKRVITVDAAGVKAGRTSGLAITSSLVRKAGELGIRFLDNILINELMKNNGRVVGATGFDRSSTEPVEIKAGAVILACGGGGQLYPFTTNTRDVSGDGYALAGSAGAELRDMEFVQFHPTVSIGPPKMVIPTTLFTEGAVLKNIQGEEYMHKYSSRGNLATRDVMSRANYTEIQEGREGRRGGVYLDLTSIPDEVLVHRYKEIYDNLSGERVIEVLPAAHFMMGGVVIDEKARTGVPGLYACGETAGGVHGANRLSANALTEAAVFGTIAGEQAAHAYKHKYKAYGSSNDGKCRNNLFDHNSHSVLKFVETKNNLHSLMDKYASVVRTKKGLQVCYQRLRKLQLELTNCRIQGKKDLIEYSQVELMLHTAVIIIESAIKRKNSTGAHYILD